MTSSLHHEIVSITDKHESARDFLFQQGILKSTMTCSGCSGPMTLIACSEKKSPDLLIWRCSPCRKFRNIRTDSILSGQKLSLQTFLTLMFYLSMYQVPVQYRSCPAHRPLRKYDQRVEDPTTRTSHRLADGASLDAWSIPQ